MNPADALAHVLVATQPHPEVESELAPFRPLIGSWDLIVTWHNDDGTQRSVKGEWHFGWALDGRAVADVWITPSRAVRAVGGESGEWGLSLRFYDPEIRAFRSTWLGPKNHVVLPFTAHAADNRITLDAEHTPGVRTRWQFTEITATTFHWQNLTSTDEGATWVLRQEMHATRAA